MVASPRYVSGEITKIPGVSTAFNVPDIANHVPHMQINWDPRRINLSAQDASKQLRNGKPSIVLERSGNGLGMSSFMLQSGEEKIIAERLTPTLPRTLGMNRKAGKPRSLVSHRMAVRSERCGLSRPSESFDCGKLAFRRIPSQQRTVRLALDSAAHRVHVVSNTRRVAGRPFWSATRAHRRSPLVGSLHGAHCGDPSFHRHSTSALMAVRFLLGAGEAIIYPASNQFVSRWIPTQERGAANGLIFAGVGVGSGLSPFLVAYTMAHHGWRFSFWVCALIGCAAGAVWYLRARDTPQQHPARIATGAGQNPVWPYSRLQTDKTVSTPSSSVDKNS